MKKQLLFLFFVIILSVSAFAQLEVKDGSFKEVPGFVNINPDDNYQTDDNDMPFAVIKVKTENIDDKQRRNLRFESNLAVGIVLEYKTGEVWVYLTAKYANYLKISHPDFGVYEFTLPEDLKPKCGYEMALVYKAYAHAVPVNDIYNYMIVIADKPDAVVYVDDVFEGEVGEDGVYKSFKAGEKHSWRIECEHCYSESGEAVIPEKEGENATISIVLRPLYGCLDITSNPVGAYIIIDGKDFGNTPSVLTDVPVGTHELKLAKEGYTTLTKSITIDDKNKLSVNEELAKSYAIGVFSVSDTKKVSFAKGNLQYQASTHTWRFAEHQWDYIGYGNSKISSSYNGWIDLFGWGTGNNPIKSTESKNEYYNFSDWGDNSIANGGGRGWVTLTKNEWEYVFYIRKTSSDIRYAKAMVNGVNGVILLPDDWSSDYYFLSNINRVEANYSSNRISQRDWTSKLEANGAVFLPAAGHRIGTNFKEVGSKDGYWSATDNGFYYSFFVHFSDSYFSPYYNSYSYYGLSVRLVCSAE